MKVSDWILVSRRPTRACDVLLHPVRRRIPLMAPVNYYEEFKYCPRCNEYVRYLMSPHASYCVHCGGRVHLFSKEDQKLFLRSLELHKVAVRRSRKKGA